MTYDLPTPPSTNSLFFNLPRGGRAKTESYRKWIRDARWSLLAQKARPIAGQVRLHFELTEKSNLDISNCIKAVEDVLVAHGVIPDDSKKYVRGGSYEWSSDVEGVRVTIKPATTKQSEAA